MACVSMLIWFHFSKLASCFWLNHEFFPRWSIIDVSPTSILLYTGDYQCCSYWLLWFPHLTKVLPSLHWPIPVYLCNPVSCFGRRLKQTFLKLSLLYMVSEVELWLISIERFTSSHLSVCLTKSRQVQYYLEASGSCEHFEFFNPFMDNS